ncbi:hypothetical protein TeGR_g839, partial [Tetraparma gracilis]
MRSVAESAVADLAARTATISAERKRNLLAATFTLLTVSLVLFGRRMYTAVRDTTAEVTGDIISHEATQIKTSELAAAVVSHVLEDKAVAEKVGSFLRKASGNGETKAALSGLVKDVLGSQEVYKAATGLVQRLFKDLAANPETARQVSGLLQEAMKDPAFVRACSLLVTKLCADPAVAKAANELAAAIQREPQVRSATAELLTASSHSVMSSPDILDHSKDFISDVILDAGVQRTSGAFLYNAIVYTFLPSALTLVASVGAGFLAVGAVAAVRGGYVAGGSADDALAKIAGDGGKLWRIAAGAGGRLADGAVRGAG